MTTPPKTSKEQVQAAYDPFERFLRDENASRGAPQEGIDSALRPAQDALARNLGYLDATRSNQNTFFHAAKDNDWDRLDDVFGDFDSRLKGFDDQINTIGQNINQAQSRARSIPTRRGLSFGDTANNMLVMAQLPALLRALR